MADRPSPPNGEERIPFYRNVKLIGGITQAVFLIVAVVAVALLVRNVQSGLGSSGRTATFARSVSGSRTRSRSPSSASS